MMLGKIGIPEVVLLLAVLCLLLLAINRFAWRMAMRGARGVLFAVFAILAVMYLWSYLTPIYPSL